MPAGGLLGDRTHFLAQIVQQVVLMAAGCQIVDFGCQLGLIDEIGFALGREDGLIDEFHSGLGNEDDWVVGLEFGLVHELVGGFAGVLHRVRRPEHSVPGSF